MLESIKIRSLVLQEHLAQRRKEHYSAQFLNSISQ